MSEANAGGAPTPVTPRIYIYKTSGGTKKAEPPVAIAFAKTSDAMFEVRCLAVGWQVEAITFQNPKITYEKRTRLINVPMGTRPGYYEYEITLSHRKTRGLTEIVQGNSSPGVLVDP